MAVHNYKKFKISLRHDSKKTQGLKTGDIVRRQYFDGKNLIYTLMCVLDYGIDKVKDSEGKDVEQSYFIGALLEGDVPKQDEILDFARITNLFDESRSGALYLTASDDQAPYMDIIDGIGKNASLCWPVNIGVTENIDPSTQYVLNDRSLADMHYLKFQNDNSRICRITKNNIEGVVGLKQDFYEYVANPNRVLISYKIKASKPTIGITSLEYVDGVRVDGAIEVPITTEWDYKFHAITVDWSGRHLRSVKIMLPELIEGDNVWIADLNIILLSSVAAFQDSSQMRLGKLTGMVDPVFGKLDGYGGYLQKLFASGSAHISGTLTAGDENGFASTFYAGKIHRNAFINSSSPVFTNIISFNNDISNPTGVGNVYLIEDGATMIAQTTEWLENHVGKEYCYSFWCYAENPCQISVLQNNHLIGIIQIEEYEIHKWKRHSVTFKLLPYESVDNSINDTHNNISNIVEIDALLNDDDIFQETEKIYIREIFDDITRSFEKAKRMVAENNFGGYGKIFSYNGETFIFNDNSLYYNEIGLAALEANYYALSEYLISVCLISKGDYYNFKKAELIEAIRLYYNSELIVYNNLAEFISSKEDSDLANEEKPLTFSLVPTYSEVNFEKISTSSDIISKDTLIEYANRISFSAPQLESGRTVTQYQPTDDILDETEDYGAWFSRGGIGGTIQNPLLKLNFDGEGSIGTRTKSFLLKTDGSGYLANKNIKWNENGDVEFGERVTLNWANLGLDIQDKLNSKSIRIIGNTIFTFTEDHSDSQIIYTPESITLSLAEENISSKATYQWYYKGLDNYVIIPGANSQTLEVSPNADYWMKDMTVVFKCICVSNGIEYADSITVSKISVSGYSIEIESEQGTTFQNGVCDTILKAVVYYKGKKIADDFVTSYFTFMWRKYQLPDIENEVENWWEEDDIDRTKQSITISTDISGRCMYGCELISIQDSPPVPDIN